MGRAGGWLARAQRLLEREDGERVEHGYLLLPLVFQHEASGDSAAAAATAGAAAAIGERFGDSDLFALAAHERGHILIQNGRLTEGLGLLDEAMVAVTAREVSPIVSGIVYCGVILACQDAYEVRRAKEWTAALSAWCERQPDLVAFTGRCLVHRAEILQLQGTWGAALDEARRASERCLQGENTAGAGEACYRQGEIQRVLGQFDAAEDAYREASRLGREPQPGLALLRLAQEKKGAAEAAIRRMASETSEAGKRAGLLPAFVEIMLAVGDVDAARDACAELDAIAEGHEDGVLGAMAALARGTVEMAGEHRAGPGRISPRRACLQQLRRPTRRPERGCWWGRLRAARSATRRPRHWRSRLHASPSRSWARRWTSLASSSTARARRPPTRKGSPTASYRCCATSPRA